MQHGMKDDNDQCRAITKSGKRCCNWVIKNSQGYQGYCKSHSKKDDLLLLLPKTLPPLINQ